MNYLLKKRTDRVNKHYYNNRQRFFLNSCLLKIKIFLSTHRESNASDEKNDLNNYHYNIYLHGSKIITLITKIYPSRYMSCLIILCGKNTKNNIYDRFHFEIEKFKLINSFETSQL